MHLYGFIGTPCFDCLFYLGSFLSFLGKRVYLLDGAGEGGPVNYIPGMDSGPVCRNGFDIGGYLPDEGYDVVLLLLPYGELTPHSLFDTLPDMEGWYVISDFFYHNVERAMECFQTLPQVRGIIMRDEPPGKINRGYVERISFLNRTEDCFFYTIPLDEEDYSLRIRIGYEPVHAFFRLSPGFKVLLRRLTEEITQLQGKQVKRQYRIWERRRII